MHLYILSQYLYVNQHSTLTMRVMGYPVSPLYMNFFPWLAFGSCAVADVHTPFVLGLWSHENEHSIFITAIFPRHVVK